MTLHFEGLTNLLQHISPAASGVVDRTNKLPFCWVCNRVDSDNDDDPNYSDDDPNSIAAHRSPEDHRAITLCPVHIHQLV